MPCLKHMPEVVAAYHRFKSQGFRILGVSADDPGKAERLRQVITEQTIPFPVIYDGRGGRGPLVEQNRVTGFPTSFLLDRKGRVRYTGLDGKELERRIAELLAEGRPR